MEYNEALPAGTYLHNGKYKIQRTLGQGGFGITYEAATKATTQGSLGGMEVEINVAIKEFFMKDGCTRDATTSSITVSTTNKAGQVDQYRRKFIKEAHNIADLNHSHIVHVSDIFEENNTVYYVMQYFNGGSLKEYVSHHANGRLSEEEALKYILSIADALRYMHTDKKMCHFDVKPGNILLDGNGNAVLIDFGISKSYDSKGHETSTTPVGISKGFAPLEQYSPETLKDFSPQSDIYSLGATYYYCLTGQVPPESVTLCSGAAFPERPSYVSPRAWRAIRMSMRSVCGNRPKDIQAFVELITFVGPLPDVEEEKDLEDDKTLIEPEHTQGVRVEVASPQTDRKPMKGYIKWVVIAFLAVAIISFSVNYLHLTSSSSKETIENATSSQTVKEYPIYASDGTVAYKYTGKLNANKLPDGAGKATYQDGRIYEGPFVNGIRQGSKAKFTFSDGNVFEGSFAGDQFAKGKLTSHQSDSYGMYFVGAFHDGQPYNGTWYNKDGSKYGSIKNGK